MKNNLATISGLICEEPSLSHAHGKIFYKTKIEVIRKSGNKDIIPCIFEEALFNFHKGDWVTLHGEIRTRNENIDGKSKLRVRLYVQEVFQKSEEENNNVWLKGAICKEVNYKITPKGNKVCEIILAVNRSFGYSDYIPVIFFGNLSTYVRHLNIGDCIQIWGRFQSREYMKDMQLNTTYEIAAYALVMESEKNEEQGN